MVEAIACDCDLTSREDSDVIGIYPGIKFCPLHAKAKEMREALAETFKHASQSYWCYCPGDALGHHIGARPDCVYTKAQALLKEIDNG